MVRRDGNAEKYGFCFTPKIYLRKFETQRLRDFISYLHNVAEILI